MTQTKPQSVGRRQRIYRSAGVSSQHRKPGVESYARRWGLEPLTAARLIGPGGRCERMAIPEDGHHELPPAADAGLGEHPLQVILHRVLGDAPATGDLAGREPRQASAVISVSTAVRP